MDRQSLIAELVGRWENRIRPLRWPERLRIFQDIRDKLVEDLGSRKSAEDVFEALVADLVERLDAEAVTARASAPGLAASADPYHRDRAAGRYAEQAEGTEDQERRRAARVPVNVTTQLNLEDNWVPCRIVDLSTGGALIDTAVMLSVGRELRLVFRLGHLVPATEFTAARALSTFSRIFAAVAVQTKGLGCSLCSAR